jgi:peptidoglycan/LPS O-acetylase OafA/YrhL
MPYSRTVPQKHLKEHVLLAFWPGYFALPNSLKGTIVEGPPDWPMELNSSRPRLPALTSLRFFAAFHVVLFHLYTMGITSGPEWYRRLSSAGYIGVGLFFVLSGFVLAYTYGDREWTPGEFWRARFARIYPAYAFSLFVTAPSFFYVAIRWQALDVPSYAWFKAHLLVSSLLPPLLLQAWVPPAALAWNAPAWSLSVEVFFYALFPLMVAGLVRARKNQLATWGVMAWTVSLALSCGYAIFNPDRVAQVNDQSVNLFWLDAVKFHPLARLPEFFTGACLGFLFLRRAIAPKWGTALVLCGAGASAIAIWFGPGVPYTLLHDSLLTPAFAAIIYGLALRPRWSALLEWKPLVLLGEASYSLYLLHIMILAAYFFTASEQARHRGPVGIVVGLALAVGISLMTYRLVEQPARRRLRPRTGDGTAALPSAVQAT